MRSLTSRSPSRGCDEPGPPPAIVWTLHEISERKRAEAALRESEERLTLAFAGAQEGVWDWNLETGAVVYSPRWKQMLGYADDEIEPHVSAWERLLHPDDMARAQRGRTRASRAARATYEGEFRLRHKDGHYVQVLSRGYPVRREPGGPVVRIVGTHFDLTERRQAEAERARTELLSRLVFAQEDERRRIAREMHDQFGEQLTALGLRHRRAQGGVRRIAGACRPRRGAREDRPADSIATSISSSGSCARPRSTTSACAPRSPTTCRTGRGASTFPPSCTPRGCSTSGSPRKPKRRSTESRRKRSTTSRSTRAPGASRSSSSGAPTRVLLIVEDDGVGFDASPVARTRAGQGFGLLGMQERAALVGATLEIESTAGQGHDGPRADGGAGPAPQPDGRS